jgi:hypothetical protein
MRLVATIFTFFACNANDLATDTASGFPNPRAR